MRLFIQLFVLGFILFIVYEVGGAWAISTQLLQPGTEGCSLENAIACEDPSDYQLRYRKVTFRTEDRLKISGWYIAGLRRHPAIVMVHGMGDSRHIGLHYASYLREQGYHLLMFDLRNHGKSTAAFNSLGLYERRDIHAAVKYLQKKRGIGSIGIFGFGTGASTAIMAMAENPSIKAGIFEGGYFEIDDFVLQVLEGKDRKAWLIPDWLVVQLYRIRAVGRGKTISPAAAIAKISPRPVFIVHGTRNPVIDFKHAKRLYLAASFPKLFWPILGGDQRTAILLDQNRAEFEFSNFFSRFL